MSEVGEDEPKLAQKIDFCCANKIIFLSQANGEGWYDPEKKHELKSRCVAKKNDSCLPIKLCVCNCIVAKFE